MKRRRKQQRLRSLSTTPPLPPEFLQQSTSATTSTPQQAQTSSTVHAPAPHVQFSLSQGTMQKLLEEADPITFSILTAQIEESDVNNDSELNDLFSSPQYGYVFVCCRSCLSLN